MLSFAIQSFIQVSVPKYLRARACIWWVWTLGWPWVSAYDAKTTSSLLLLGRCQTIFTVTRPKPTSNFYLPQDVLLIPI
jgi:hypothetical protein